MIILVASLIFFCANLYLPLCGASGASNTNECVNLCYLFVNLCLCNEVKYLSVHSPSTTYFSNYFAGTFPSS